MILLEVLARKFSSSSDPPPQRAALRQDISEMLVQLRTVGTIIFSREFAVRLNAIAINSPQLETGVVAWVNLIEVLIQGAEQRYPEGNGPRKKAQVRSALHQLITTNDVQIPSVPPVLQPVVLEIVLDWAVDILVDGVNQYNLWDDSEPFATHSAFRMFLSGMLNGLQPIVQYLMRLYVQLRYWRPLSPEVQAAVDRARQENLIATKRAAFGTPADLLLFMSQHRGQVIAGFKLFLEVVHQAQRIENLSGPEKKTYARDIVLSLLEELGFPVGSGLIGAIATNFIDAGIESAYNLLRRRAPELFNNATQPVTGGEINA
jgi:hypothetical protein